MLALVLLPILFKHLVPFLLSRSTISGMLVIHVIDFLRNDEGLFGIEAELCLNVLGILRFQRVPVYSASTLQLGPETNSSGQLDDRRFIFNFLTFLDGSLNARQVVITIFDVLSVPPIRTEPRQDVFGESTLGVAICTGSVHILLIDHVMLTNGNVVVIVNHDKIP